MSSSVVAGLTSEVNNPVYGSSKGAVHTWTRSVAWAWGSAGVHVNSFLPFGSGVSVAVLESYCLLIALRYKALRRTTDCA